MALQGSTYPYCDITTDLRRVFDGIDNFASRNVMNEFTLVSGQTNTYEKRNTGYVGAVWQNGTELTAKTSIATVEGTAGTWWYDSTNDILYVHSTNNADPDTHTIETATDDWVSEKTQARNDAMEMVESMLDPRFPRPLPFARYSYTTGDVYDYDLKRATALMTCFILIKRHDPTNPLCELFRKEVWDEETKTGILYEHFHGSRAFSFETTKDDFKGRLENIVLDSTSTGRVYLAGQSDSEDHYQIRVKIDTAGAVETATYKASLDNGRSWDSTLNTTYEQFTHLAFGIYVRFVGTFILNDEWLIDIPGKEETINSRISTINLRFEL